MEQASVIEIPEHMTIVNGCVLPKKDGAKEGWSDIPAKVARPYIDAATEIASKHTGIPVDRIRSTSRKREIVASRMITVCLATWHINSRSVIGRRLKKDHATVINSIKRAHELVEVYASFQKTMRLAMAEYLEMVEGAHDVTTAILDEAAKEDKDSKKILKQFKQSAKHSMPKNLLILASMEKAMDALKDEPDSPLKNLIGARIKLEKQRIEDEKDNRYFR